MGRKQGGKRQLVHFCAAGLACLFFLGCAAGTVTREIQSAKAIPVREKDCRAEVPPHPAPVVCPEPALVCPPAPQPSAAPVPEAQPAAPPAAAQPPKFASVQVQRARKLMAQRDYEGSVKAGERALVQAGSQGPADEALFSLGLIYAALDNPKRDYAKAVAYFQRLVKEFPKSPLADEAKAWVGILQENQALKEVIEKTKEVDIAVDEKKRR